MTLHRRLFLTLVVTALLAACGGKTITPNNTGDDAGMFGRGPDSGDGSNGYIDPRCPDVGAPMTAVECDVFDPSTCNPGEACSPAVIPPQAPCEPETYGAFCFMAGVGTQGASCSGTANCAAGYVCLITGTSTQCARMCSLDSNDHPCADGYVCEPIDVPGFSACL
jgi:hypothetical protein